jgi:hypothetical protein
VGATVFANGMSIACKASSGKTIAAMPDVCLSPPSPPAGPIPIPYPNTAAASDTDKGSKTVQIGGQPVMLKDKSVFKTSTGNEAATKSFGMSVVTHQIQGDASFVAWSMDVKFEGENVPRHLDLMGHNEACSPTATPPWIFADSMATDPEGHCDDDKEKETHACKDYKPAGKKDVCQVAGLAKAPRKKAAWASAAAERSAANECAAARRCQLVPYNGKEDGVSGCCKSQTPDHLIPASSFYKGARILGVLLGPWRNKYNAGTAPCMCAEGATNTHGNHGLRHSIHKALGSLMGMARGSTESFDEQANLAARSATLALQSSGCSTDCIKLQIVNGHKGKDGMLPDVKHSPCGRKLPENEFQKLRKAVSDGAAIP